MPKEQAQAHEKQQGQLESDEGSWKGTRAVESHEGSWKATRAAGKGNRTDMSVGGRFRV